jgi:mono-ADP-ribosyltransferase sirtuin 6
MVNTPEEVASMDFGKARPTLTHQAITKLAHVGKLKYCITQNVDGLHRRSGLSRDVHCAVHGCAFTEQCHTCFAEYFRDKDVGGMSFQPTGNSCDLCHGKLYDTLLDWEDALPQNDFKRAEDECDRADLILCLGTSLRIEPAGSLPLRATRFVIVNLQVTPYDSDAAMIIKAPVDEVMDALMMGLGFREWKNEPSCPIERVWNPSSQEILRKVKAEVTTNSL